MIYKGQLVNQSFSLFVFDVLRTRPVIHLTKDFVVEPKIVDPNQCPGTTPWWYSSSENLPSVIGLLKSVWKCIRFLFVFHSITATLCMSFTLSNGNKNFKKNISKSFFFFGLNYKPASDVKSVYCWRWLYYQCMDSLHLSVTSCMYL